MRDSSAIIHVRAESNTAQPSKGLALNYKQKVQLCDYSCQTEAVESSDLRLQDEVHTFPDLNASLSEKGTQTSGENFAIESQGFTVSGEESIFHRSLKVKLCDYSCQTDDVYSSSKLVTPHTRKSSSAGQQIVKSMFSVGNLYGLFGSTKEDTGNRLHGVNGRTSSDTDVKVKLCDYSGHTEAVEVSENGLTSLGAADGHSTSDFHSDSGLYADSFEGEPRSGSEAAPPGDRDGSRDGSEDVTNYVTAASVVHELKSEHETMQETNKRGGSDLATAATHFSVEVDKTFASSVVYHRRHDGRTDDAHRTTQDAAVTQLSSIYSKNEVGQTFASSIAACHRRLDPDDRTLASSIAYHKRPDLGESFQSFCPVVSINRFVETRSEKVDEDVDGSTTFTTAVSEDVLIRENDTYIQTHRDVVLKADMQSMLKIKRDAALRVGNVSMDSVLTFENATAELRVKKDCQAMDSLKGTASGEHNGVEEETVPTSLGFTVHNEKREAGQVLPDSLPHNPALTIPEALGQYQTSPAKTFKRSGLTRSLRSLPFYFACTGARRSKINFTKSKEIYPDALENAMDAKSGNSRVQASSAREAYQSTRRVSAATQENALSRQSIELQGAAAVEKTLAADRIRAAVDRKRVKELALQTARQTSGASRESSDNGPAKKTIDEDFKQKRQILAAELTSAMNTRARELKSSQQKQIFPMKLVDDSERRKSEIGATQEKVQLATKLDTVDRRASEIGTSQQKQVLPMKLAEERRKSDRGIDYKEALKSSELRTTRRKPELKEDSDRRKSDIGIGKQALVRLGGERKRISDIGTSRQNPSELVSAGEMKRLSEIGTAQARSKYPTLSSSFMAKHKSLPSNLSTRSIGTSPVKTIEASSDTHLAKELPTEILENLKPKKLCRVPSTAKASIKEKEEAGRQPEAFGDSRSASALRAGDSDSDASKSRNDLSAPSGSDVTSSICKHTSTVAAHRDTSSDVTFSCHPGSVTGLSAISFLSPATHSTPISADGRFHDNVQGNLLPKMLLYRKHKT
jgi:hypothetical protein